MNEPASEGQWFQVAISIAIASLTAAFAWMRVQIGQVKRDASSADEGVRREMLEAIRSLDDKLTRRHDDANAVQNRQHEDNQSRYREIKDDIARAGQVATLERQRTIDFLAAIQNSIAQKPDRAEVFSAMARGKIDEKP